MQALQKAVHDGVRPTVRSGGHCYENFTANNPGGVLIDLSLLNSVDPDPSTGEYCVAPGAVLGDVYQSLYKRYGLTLPAGSCYSVGAGGHISGGGYGLLSRLQGLSSDWLTAVDILTVDASGRVMERRVDREERSGSISRLPWRRRSRLWDHHRLPLQTSARCSARSGGGRSALPLGDHDRGSVRRSADNLRRLLDHAWT